MKIFFLCILIVAATNNCFSQSNALSAQKDTPISYSETVHVDGVTKNELFIRARDWASNNCKNLKIQDKETGEISANGSIEGDVTIHFLGAHTATATFDFVISIWIKDGTYKYTITNIDNTKINETTFNGIFGMLYVTKHCPAKGISLSQAKLDEAYQSLKDGFDKNEKELVDFLKRSLANQSTSDF